MANYKSDGWKVIVYTFPKLTPIYRKIGKVTTGPTIDALNKLCGNEQPALFVLDWVNSGGTGTKNQVGCKKCYGTEDKYKIRLLLTFLKEIYAKKYRSQEIIQYLEQDDHDTIQKQKEKVSIVKRWIVENPPDKGLLTRTESVDGLSHPVIICFQENNPKSFERNIFLVK